MADFFALIVFAMSLCADCFAVTACSSVTLRRLDWKTVGGVALVFGVVQAGLLLVGWAFGDLFVGYVERFAHWIGFLLLLYVGGSMLVEALRGCSECRDLRGLKNVVLGAFATSMDAFAVGISFSMDAGSAARIKAQTVAVFFVTALSVVLGMAGGQRLGSRLGRPAEAVGGIVLILIGLNILLGLV